MSFHCTLPRPAIQLQEIITHDSGFFTICTASCLSMRSLVEVLTPDSPPRTGAVRLTDTCPEEDYYSELLVPFPGSEAGNDLALRVAVHAD
jgi:hypothetical protein